MNIALPDSDMEFKLKDCQFENHSCHVYKAWKSSTYFIHV